jgi:4'-phosphopantetheinyl transferase EntD
VRFPHPALSLSHSAGTAVAVGVSPAHADGLGVDVELPRTIDVRATRFFLAERERRRFPVTDPDVVQLLWTAKEAVFKADLGNRGRVLLDYEVVELDEEVRGGDVREGVARRGPTRFRFRTCMTPDLVLSIARPEREAQ